MFWKTIGVIALNSLVVFPVSVYILISVVNKYTVKHSFDIKDLPDKFTLIWQLSFCLLVEDIGFSFCHRLLHSHPFLYKHIHKLHHQYSQAVGISATYTHPLEFAFGNMLPVGMPCFILGSRMHIYTFLVWTVYRITSTTHAHSGYDFPWMPWDMLPMKSSSIYHDFHHSGGDFSGNFCGQMTIWDTIWGTNKVYYKQYVAQMEEKLFGKKLQ